MKNILKNKWVALTLVLSIGIIIGKFMGGTSTSVENSTHQQDESADAETWTCSMHPQIQQDEPGKCPLCGMDLIPLDNSMEGEDTLPDEVSMSASAMKLAEIQTFVVKKESPEKEIRLLGKVKADERLIFSQAVHFPGRIEKLFVNFTGEKVRKGQKFASVYSTELVTAQKELFEVLKDESTNPILVEAARNKLKQWKFTNNQISDLEKSGKVQTDVDILSDYSGYVSMRMVSEGDHFKEGQILFEITDLSKIWVLFEAYENDLSWIKLGDKLDIEFKSVPGVSFDGKVTFIDPFINPKTRVAYVRVELPNRKGQLKPDMFANGIITSKLPTNKNVILVPKSAVLWTGKRAVVYVKLPDREHNSFIYREVVLGEDAGDFYIVKEGLEEGEEIASNGVFKIDASAQLAGKKSMMNPTNGKVSTEHNHGDNSNMSEQESEQVSINTSAQIFKVSDKFKNQLKNVFKAYLPLKNALVSTDSENVIKTAKDLLTGIERVDMSLVEGEAHLAWMADLGVLKNTIKTIVENNDVKNARTAFAPLSDQLYQTLVKFEVEGINAYRQYCPMAFHNKGAFWLSGEKEIRNPYFGDTMLTCGEVKSEIK